MKTAAHAVLAFTLLAAACESAPQEPIVDGGDGGYELTVSPAQLTVEQADTLRVIVRVERDEGFDEAVILAADSLPGGLTLPSVTVPAGADSAVLTLSASAQTAPGPAAFVLYAVAPGVPVVRRPLAVQVVPVVGSVEIDVEKWPLAYDDVAELRATVRALDGSEISSPVSWISTDTSVIVLLETTGAVVRAQGWGEGLTTVMALSDSVWGTAGMTVDPAPVHEVVVSGPAAVLERGLTMELGAIPYDSHGHELNRLIAWSSSDENVLTVGEWGEVLAVGSGAAAIHATADGTVGTWGITVPELPIGSIRVSPDYAIVLIDDQVAFSAEVVDVGGVAMDRTVRWRTITPGIVSIDATTGVATALAAGLGGIEAYIDGEAVVGSAQMLVQDPTPPPVDHWTATLSSLSLVSAPTWEGCTFSSSYEGGTVTLNTALSDQYIDIDFDGTYTSTLQSGDCTNLVGMEGTWGFHFLNPHDQQEFVKTGWTLGPDLTSVDVQLTGSVPLHGAFTLELTLTPYAWRTDPDTNEEYKVFGPASTATLNFAPVE